MEENLVTGGLHISQGVTSGIDAFEMHPSNYGSDLYVPGMPTGETLKFKKLVDIQASNTTQKKAAGMEQKSGDIEKVEKEQSIVDTFLEKVNTVRMNGVESTTVVTGILIAGVLIGLGFVSGKSVRNLTGRLRRNR